MAFGPYYGYDVQTRLEVEMREWVVPAGVVMSGEVTRPVSLVQKMKIKRMFPVRKDLVPEINREPLMRRTAAFLVGRGESVGKVTYDDLAEDVLSSVDGVIGKVAIKYEPSFPKDDVAELVHECSIRVLRSFGNYKPYKKCASDVSTWTWRVSENFFRTRWRNREKLDFVPEDEVAEASVGENWGIGITDDMRFFVANIVAKHPKKRELIMAVLFDPNDVSAVMPARISPKAVGERVGMDPRLVSAFITRTVRPAATEWFNGDR